MIRENHIVTTSTTWVIRTADIDGNINYFTDGLTRYKPGAYNNAMNYAHKGTAERHAAGLCRLCKVVKHIVARAVVEFVE